MPPQEISQPQIMQGQQAMLPQPAIIPQPPMTPQQYINTPQIIPQQQILRQQPAQTQSVVLNQNTPGTNQQQHAAAPPSQSLPTIPNQFYKRYQLFQTADLQLYLLVYLIFNMSSTLCGKHLHAQAREMAFNVYQWIKSQNEDQCTKEIKEKVSRATRVSVSTIKRIIKEGSTSPKADTDKRFKSPEKKN
ncbi:hypothetical protein FQA39_LY14789 [Lamprigera yunnana]|nr:hypothetical protein FQA39_LY14789 [Lamprigera yunnana]